MANVVQLAYLLLQLTFDTRAYDILGIFTTNAKSYEVVFSSLMMELARRGHGVEVYTVLPSNHVGSNYREISIRRCSDDYVRVDDIEVMGMTSPKFVLHIFGDILRRYRNLRNCLSIMKLVNCTRRFDAVVVEPFDTELFAAFAGKFNATLMNIFPNLLYFHLYERMGSISNPSYVNDLMMETPRSFWQMALNVVLYIFRVLFQNILAFRTTESVRCDLFGSGGPTLEEMVGNTSLINIVQFAFHH